MSIHWSAFFYNLCVALNSLLLFFAIFAGALELPVLLQVAGRAHPLVLHFPIVLAALCCFMEWAPTSRHKPELSSLRDGLMLSAAVSACFAAILGLFLSREGGYDEKLLAWHQWSGVALSLFLWGWYSFRNRIRNVNYASWATSGAALVILVLAGHQGAVLTHGEHYLLAPMGGSRVSEMPADLNQAIVFEDVVRPILKEKCMNCHNAAKLKGELNMEAEPLLLKGGKNGALWDTSAADFGLLMRRLHLPMEEKEHMPPKGKPQLSPQEIQLLYYWIKNGASFTQKLTELPENDSLRYWSEMWLREQMQQNAKAPTPYPFGPADQALVDKLNNNFRTVRPLDRNSPALSVEFFGKAAFSSASLKELEPVKTQIVDLNLNQMPVADEDLKILASFENLQKLNLAFTRIEGPGLSALGALKSLQSLSLSGTSVHFKDLEILKNLGALKNLYLWNTGLSEEDMQRLKGAFPQIRIESGYSGQGVVAKLNAPIIESAGQVFSGQMKVKLKGFIPGAELRYTLDGSVPDSLNALLFSGDSITVDKSCQLSAKAFLPGWHSSEVSARSFYKSGLIPDSIALIYPPNPQYKGEGPNTLVNQKIGDTDFRSNKWLACRETNLEALFFFRQPTTLSSVSVSSLVDIGSYIMPAAEVQVWGGKDRNSLVLLAKLRPEQPQKLGAPGFKTGFNCRFKPQKIKVLKLVAKPVAKLPAWHPGKGERGWVFVDEVFLE